LRRAAPPARGVLPGDSPRGAGGDEAEFHRQVFGTDLDSGAIERRAPAAIQGIAADVSPQRLERFFHRETAYRIRGVRELAIFAPQNVIRDPPFTSSI
jgi:chemotaxis methyl-accepting protein methylase